MDKKELDFLMASLYKGRAEGKEYEFNKDEGRGWHSKVDRTFYPAIAEAGGYREKPKSIEQQAAEYACVPCHKASTFQQAFLAGAKAQKELGG